ncbi:MAG TPA: hypothetical protein VMN81_00385 [Vicinamibacterales bacterium]|nr:hypothetical protein [Vicinamibacterales bacterium]
MDTLTLNMIAIAVSTAALLAQAPLTTLLAAALLHERLTPLELAGGALVLAGIYVVNRAEMAPPRPAAPRAGGPSS